MDDAVRARADAAADGTAAPAWQGSLEKRWKREYGQTDARENIAAGAEPAPSALADQRRLVADVIAALREGAYLLDASGRIVAANLAAERMLGRREDELHGRHIHDLAHGGGNGAARHAAEKCPLTKALRTGTATRHKRELLQHRDGRPVPVAWATTPLMLAGTPAALFTFHVIAERKSEAHQRAELDAMIEAIGASVFVCDSTGQIVRVNRRAAERLGKAPGEMLRPIGEIVQPHELRRLDGSPLPEEERPLTQALHGITRTDVRFVLHRADTGKDIQVQCSFAPIRDATGAISGGVAVATDISRLFWLERQKDEFLSIAAHELRTPLTSLKLLTQLTRRRLQKLDALEAEQFVRMERSINRMEQLINELLDVSRIQAGKLTLRRERCDLAALCALVAEEQAALFERPVMLRLPQKRALVEVDVERMANVIANLLSNALKYSMSKLPVTLELSASGGWATVAIHDEGGGIPEEARSRLFERFYRVPGVQVQSGSGVGLGLGLYICREIVQRHGGQIWVESEMGRGSTFAFRLALDER